VTGGEAFPMPRLMALPVVMPTSCPCSRPGRSRARRAPVPGRSLRSLPFREEACLFGMVELVETPPWCSGVRFHRNWRRRGREDKSAEPLPVLGLDTRWVTAFATGSTTTRLTSPQIPSLQLASTPIVNCGGLRHSHPPHVPGSFGVGRTRMACGRITPGLLRV